jgi:hypothetical protein
MSRIQSIILALLGAVLIYLGVQGDGILHNVALIAAGVYLCAAFTPTTGE